MSLFFRIYEHLLPKAQTWQMKLQNQTRDFFEGLVGLPTDFRTFIDGIWSDLWALETTQLDEWEEQWALKNTNLTDDERRARIDSKWKAVGGQSPRYLQDIVRANGFDVFIHEWFEPGSSPPVLRNPLLVLASGGVLFSTSLDEPLMELGEPTAELGETFTPRGYVLVNKINTTLSQFLGLGDPIMECGEPLALLSQDLGTIFGTVEYLIPTDPATWPYFLYWGDQTFPDQATVDAARRDEFEDLILTLCPGQQWLGVLVDYT